MPPRPPPPPGVLTVLCSIAAVAAVWACAATDQVGRGLAGAALGVPLRGLEVSAANRYLVVALQGEPTTLGAGAFALLVLAGAVLTIGVAYGLYLLVITVRSAGWLRGLVLAWLVTGLLWLPAAFAAATLPGGSGPVAELYARLGEPMAGRWTALALGLFGLWLAAAMASRGAIEIGRSWMRTDGVDFRRRLVRVTAGWPGAISLLLLAFGVGWAASPGIVLLVPAWLLALHFQTR